MAGRARANVPLIQKEALPEPCSCSRPTTRRVPRPVGLVSPSLAASFDLGGYESDLIDTGGMCGVDDLGHH